MFWCDNLEKWDQEHVKFTYRCCKFKEKEGATNEILLSLDLINCER